MTINFDAPGGIVGQILRRGSQDELETGPCGRAVDWSRGLERLSRYQTTSKGVPDSLLTKVIEGEIIPRLLLAHREIARSPSERDNPGAILSVDSFARLVLASQSDDILTYVNGLLDRGITLDRIFLDLLAPVARKLGVFWEEDICTFVDVALALTRLHQVLREIGRRDYGFYQGVENCKAFFAPVPGESHTFGVSMLEEFFRHAGWQTGSDNAATVASILQVAATEHLDIIGFSVGCEELLDPLSELIEKTRKASRNRDVVIMVGGGLFTGRRDLATMFNNSTVVADGIHAVRLAEEIMSRLRRPGAASAIV